MSGYFMRFGLKKSENDDEFFFGGNFLSFWMILKTTKSLVARTDIYMTIELTVSSLYFRP